MSDGSVSTATDSSPSRHNQAPSEIQEAIEKGDWAAVGATAAMLASTSDMGDSSHDRSSQSIDDDEVRAAEIDQLVENGNWDVSNLVSFLCLAYVCS